MTKAKLIKAMPLGSKWDGSIQQGGVWVPQRGGTRTVAAYHSNYISLDREGDQMPAILDYPKRVDELEISEDGKTITIGFTGVNRGAPVSSRSVWSRIKYERV